MIPIFYYYLSSILTDSGSELKYRREITLIKSIDHTIGIYDLNNKLSINTTDKDVLIKNNNRNL